jgi:hypothetical protein
MGVVQSLFGPQDARSSFTSDAILPAAHKEEEKEGEAEGGISHSLLPVSDTAKADPETLLLFHEIMKAKRQKKSVQRILRDQLLRSMHYMHGYGEH